MFDAARIKSDKKPDKIEYLGDNLFYYNYDIQTEEIVNEDMAITGYSFIQVKIHGKPDYKKCIKALIRAYIDETKEFEIINNYNSFQLGLEDNQDYQDEYNEYLNIVSEIKNNVYADFGITKKEKKVSVPRQQDLFTVMTLSINTMSLSDEDSLKVKTLYPKWESFIGKSLSTGMKVIYNDLLYKVRQEIATVLENQPPSIDTAALYEEIVESHAGTYEDPIPYNNNMELFNGKYYSQNEVIYLCNRDTGQAVYQNLADLVGIYVEIATA